MRVIRTDLRTGQQTLIAGYENINEQTGQAFVEAFAQKEANERDDVKSFHYRMTSKNVCGYHVHKIAIPLVGHDGQAIVEYTLECPIPATYTSEFDDSLTCTSACNYYEYSKEVTDIEMAENSSDADDANSLTDEYITLPDDTILREKDGVTFDY